MSKVQDYAETAGSNTVIGSIDIDEGMAPSDVNNAMREEMSHLRKWNLTYNFMGGLVPSNDSDADHDISISVGDCADSTNVQMIHLDTAIVKQIDVNWAAGTGAGGFPSGLTLTADTWYYLFVIGKTDGTSDAGFDTSATAANLLTDATGYTLYRRIGSVLTDATSNILAFKAWETPGGGLLVNWRNSAEDVDVSNQGTSEVQYTLTVPTGYNVLARFRATTLKTGTTVAMSFYSPDETTDPTPSTVSNRSLSTEAAGAPSSGHFKIMTDTSARINAIASTASNDLDIQTIGWEDLRR